MPFYLSPGVNVVEKDLTSIIPAVSTSIGAFAGPFVWGPVMDPTTISSENELVARFGKPTGPSALTSNAASWFTAANFLAYTNNLLTIRIDTVNARNAVAIQSGTVSAVTVSNVGSGYTSPTVSFTMPDTEGGIQATGTAVIGNNVTVQVPTFIVSDVVITNGGSGYTSPSITFSQPQLTGTAATGTVTVVGGVITDIVITAGGSGYTSAPTFEVTDANGSGFTGSVTTIAGQTQTSTVNGAITGIVITNPGSGYTSVPLVTVTDNAGSGFAATASVTLGGIKVNNDNDYELNYINGAGLVGPWVARYPGALGNSIRVEMVDAAAYNLTETVGGVTSYVFDYRAEFDSAPGTSQYVGGSNGSNDELHIIVIDDDGLWTGTRGAILEKFAYVSKASDSRKSDGTNNYYKNVVNTNSKYIRWMDHPTNVAVSGAAWGTPAKNSTYKSLTSVSGYSLSGGVDDLVAEEGNLINAYAIFANSEVYDISLIPTGAVPPVVAKYIIENVAEIRKDCVAFVSPCTLTGGVIQGIDAVENTIAYRTQTAFNVNSSYGVLDSGWKYQYDRYYDVYRWVPLNGDIAGLCARTDYTNDAWWSPGGLNRGQIKSVVKLNINPNKTERDNLYKIGINPVVSFPGEGTVLFGDKTLLAKPSAFDRINVRRLFIVLEKAIATAAKYQLFEFNDSFTRAQFRSMTEPFLRDVQGRRGVIDFRVVCDERNNTGEVIDRNEFVADIYIKPARSINFITLNFIAARTGIAFEEIGA